MKNVKGSDGSINLGGMPGYASALVDCRDADFLENIEEGIRPTVEALVRAGFLTVSSCQGHPNAPIRTVTVIGEIESLRWLQLVIAEINDQAPNRAPIYYWICPKPESCTLYPGVFQKPTLLSIAFGHYRFPDTAENQRDFERLLGERPRAELHEEPDSRLVKPYLHRIFSVDRFFPGT